MATSMATCWYISVACQPLPSFYNWLKIHTPHLRITSLHINHHFPSHNACCKKNHWSKLWRALPSAGPPYIHFQEAQTQHGCFSCHKLFNLQNLLNILLLKQTSIKLATLVGIQLKTFSPIEIENFINVLNLFPFLNVTSQSLWIWLY